MYGVKSNKKGDHCGLFSRKAEDKQWDKESEQLKLKD